MVCWKLSSPSACKSKLLLGIYLRGKRESLMDNLRQQMKDACSVCEKHLHAKLDNLLGVNKDENAQAVMSAFAIFNHEKLPDYRKQLELLYGNKKLKVLNEVQREAYSIWMLS
ncbi:hypothetical protein QQF64_029895 [Cirrhinus molitorella]|uniref:Uncharacterized protein n=1 Tax=Cirrhinus molitorella TaxID=172907 RepID=A0ABR3N1V5_9TELE